MSGRRHPWWVGPAAAILRRLVTTLAASCRVISLEGLERIDELAAAGRPAILAFWHEDVVFAAYLLRRLVHRNGLRVAWLVSRSRDGELAARVLAPLGVGIVRGSASRGGREALKALHRALTREGRVVIAVPDGPRGPARTFKEGVLALAELAGAPIVPLAWSAEHTWRLASWDGLKIPRPWTRLAVAVGAPQDVPRGLEPGAREEIRTRCEEALVALGALAAGRLEPR